MGSRPTWQSFDQFVIPAPEDDKIVSRFVEAIDEFAKLHASCALDADGEMRRAWTLSGRGISELELGRRPAYTDIDILIDGSRKKLAEKLAEAGPVLQRARQQTVENGSWFFTLPLHDQWMFYAHNTARPTAIHHIDLESRKEISAKSVILVATQGARVIQHIVDAEISGDRNTSVAGNPVDAALAFELLEHSDPWSLAFDLAQIGDDTGGRHLLKKAFADAEIALSQRATKLTADWKDLNDQRPGAISDRAVHASQFDLKRAHETLERARELMTAQHLGAEAGAAFLSAGDNLTKVKIRYRSVANLIGIPGPIQGKSDVPIQLTAAWRVWQTAAAMIRNWQHVHRAKVKNHELYVPPPDQRTPSGFNNLVGDIAFAQLILDNPPKEEVNTAFGQIVAKRRASDLERGEVMKEDVATTQTIPRLKVQAPAS